MTGGSGAETLNYNLYKDAGFTSVWGVTIPTDTVAATGNGSPQDYPVYGRLPAQTTPSIGLYSDTVAVTVTY